MTEKLADDRNARDVINLASRAVNGEIPEGTEYIDLEAVYILSSRHMIAAAVGMALESAGVKDRQFTQAVAAAQRKAVIFQNALAKVSKALEEAGIWYMPLKGAVMKDLYPKYGMREFVDYDLMIDASRAGDVKQIMEGLGFRTETFGIRHHDVYFKDPCLNFQMHTTLFDAVRGDKLYEYYRNAEERLKGEGCEKRFSEEDFYVYCIAHEYRHYSGGGTGLRSLLDTYVFLKAKELNMVYVAAETEKMGIRGFEEKNRSLALHLFGGEALSAEDQEMLDYILDSGTYGTMNHRVQNALEINRWSKTEYMLKRFFVPVSRKSEGYDGFAGTYPFFYQHRILLPLLPFYRTFMAIKAGRFRVEAEAIRGAHGVREDRTAEKE